MQSLAEIVQPFHPFRVTAACEVEPWTLSLLVKACKSLPALEYTFFRQVIYARPFLGFHIWSGILAKGAASVGAAFARQGLPHSDQNCWV